MPASPDEIRAWARSTGRDVSPRGPVSADLRSVYEAEHPGGPEPGPDEFGDGGLAEPGPPPGTEEQRPRPVAAPSVRGRVTALRARGRKAGKPGPKKAKARVPVDDLIAALWRGLAGVARPLPPTSRLLKLQAPVAGMILEDTVRGTVVDRVLQPFARTSKAGEAVWALAGPPVLITVMQLQPEAAPLLIPLLRESLLAWGKIAGPKMEQAMKRESDFEEATGQDVDAMIAFLFADPADPAADDAAVHAMQEQMAS